MKFISLLLLISSAAWNTSLGQANGYLLLISDSPCEISVDGAAPSSLESGKPNKIELLPGEHYISAQSNGKEKSEAVLIEAGKQKMLRFSFGKAESKTPKKGTNLQVIADLEQDLIGGIAAGVSFNNGRTEAEVYPRHRYQLQEGDTLMIDIEMLSKKGTNELFFDSYPDGNNVFSVDKFTDLKEQKIRIPHTGIYEIELSTNHSFDKRARLKVSRIPIDAASANQSTKVVPLMKYEVVAVQEPMKQWINSTSNETWKGGSSEITVPVNLPPNTLEWYYVVSASRNEASVNQSLDNVGLFQELTTALGGVNPATMILNIGLGIITQPPGSDYCDVYLLSYENQALFSRDQAFSYTLEGTRENVTSAKVKVKNTKTGQCYLGFRNRDMMNGIGIVLEVVAITGEPYFGVEE